MTPKSANGVGHSLQVDTKACAHFFIKLPVLQWALNKTDLVLQILNEAVTWTVKGSSESNTTTLPWLLFLPILITVQVYRMAFSVAFIMLSGHALTSDDVSKYIKELREKICSLQKENETEETPSQTNECSWPQRMAECMMKSGTIRAHLFWPITMFFNFVQDIYQIAYEQVNNIFKAIKDVEDVDKEPEPSESHQEKAQSDAPESESNRTESEQHNDNQENHNSEQQEHHSEQHHY